MSLTSKQTKYLRGLAQRLKTVVRVGDKGLGEPLVLELDQALERHELLKVSIAGADRETRRELSEQMCRETGAELVQQIGRVSVLYRPAQQPRLALPE